MVFHAEGATTIEAHDLVDRLREECRAFLEWQEGILAAEDLPAKDDERAGIHRYRVPRGAVG
jgi:hypothetical protein